MSLFMPMTTPSVKLNPPQPTHWFGVCFEQGPLQLCAHQDECAGTALPPPPSEERSCHPTAPAWGCCPHPLLGPPPSKPGLRYGCPCYWVPKAASGLCSGRSAAKTE